SCESGICSTCRTRLISGEADHRDDVLTPAEKAANSHIMICISRAKPGETLVLDLYAVFHPPWCASLLDVTAWKAGGFETRPYAARPFRRGGFQTGPGGWEGLETCGLACAGRSGRTCWPTRMP